MVQSLFRDVRAAARSLSRSPGFTLVALLTLALGIGSNTVVFSVVRTVLLRPLPYTAPHELVALWTTRRAEGVQDARSAWANVDDWRAQARTLADVAVHDPVSATVGTGVAAERVVGVRASVNFFSVLGAAPALGRTFVAEDADRPERVVVLSHETWQRRLGADPAVLDAQLLIDGRPRQVVGVMPPDFTFIGGPRAFWEPLTTTLDASVRSERGTGGWQVLARLRPDADYDVAQTELNSIAARLEQEYPVHNEGLGVRVVPLRDQWIGAQVRAALWVLWGAVGFVLLIACANVANLLIARGAARRGEMAIRIALGARKSHLLRHTLAESLLLSIAGGAIGTAIAIWALELLPWLGAGDIPRLDRVSADAVVLGFSLGLALLVAAIFGALPALDASRRALAPTLRGTGRSSRGHTTPRVRRALVVAQLALAMITLTGASLLGRSLMRVLDLDLGFDTRDVQAVRLALPEERSPEERAVFYGELLDRMRNLGGVEAAGAINDLFVSNTPDRWITVEGSPTAPGGAVLPYVVDEVTPGFFQSIHVPLLRGRPFAESDRAGSAPVVVINETMARRLWPASDPVGRRLQLGRRESEAPWLTVVGVVGDFHRSGPEVAVRPQVFRPFAQSPSRSMTVLLRSTTSGETVLAALRAHVAAVEPAVPLYGIATLDQQVGGYAAARRFQMRLLTGFALAALALAAIGVFGLVSHSVSDRTAEIGARMALGATGGNILRSVLGESLVVTGIGIGVGLLGAFAVGWSIRSLLFEVAPIDPVALLTACLLLVVATLVSCYLPARRASRLDPMSVLRSE